MEASAHIFVDDKEIIECIPFLTAPPEKAWHVVYNTPIDNKLFGVDANDAAGGVELCYGGNINLQAAYKRYIWVLAYSCYKHGLNPATDITGHHILDPSRKTDPMNAFKLLGKTFDDFVADVVAEYKECTTKEDEEEMPKLDQGVAQTIINTWMSPDWEDCMEKKKAAEAEGDEETAGALQKQADYIHWLANEVRKASGQPEE